jgi:predicted dithiol-disulfide oxidoreductase (DUF899 family)
VLPDDEIICSWPQPRHVDTIWPLWNVFDLLPQGRGSDWYPANNYAGT